MRKRSEVLAFTLVELLVVIGIIAVLISVLLPTLAGARRAAETAQSLSNLRQIGQGFAMYSSEHLGWGIPGFIRQSPAGGRGEETWATILVVKKYIRITVDQMDYIGVGGSLPGDDAFASDGSAGNTVFRCPSGSNKQNTTNNSADWIPTSKQDDRNSWFWRRQSLLHGGVNESRGTAPIVDNWYAFNGILPPAGQDAFPMRTLNHTRSPESLTGGPLIKVSKIKKSAEMAMIFDGVQAHDYNTNKISTRHGKRRNQCNFLFADGHAETVDAGQLPKGGGTTSQWTPGDTLTSDLRSVATLAKYPFPKWRLDQ
jgi:prepilin-type processing-associated H-X9-DG protein